MGWSKRLLAAGRAQRIEREYRRRMTPTQIFERITRPQEHRFACPACGQQWIGWLTYSQSHWRYANDDNLCPQCQTPGEIIRG